MVTRWAVVIAPETVKHLAKIPNPDRRRLLTAIDALHTGPSGNIKPLRRRSEYCLRVGLWRVVMIVDEAALTINILSVGPRGDIYKSLNE